MFGADTTFSVFKWLKFQVDYRNLQIIDSKSSFAFRFNFGVASPYGKQQNLALPYNKRFYVGGSNSLRAWQVRRLGPGSFGEVKEINADKSGLANINYQLEQGGDMVIETSLEYRKKLIGFVDYALFLDAGNIWIIKSDQKILDAQGDDGIFQFENFLREFAVGIGIGLRLDFSFLVFRLDGAVQVVDPAQEVGERFVLDDINLFARFGNNKADKAFFNNKTNLNIGIGFPF
ncbi:MAG: BamA/TamA family outer membrane protein [Bacteroidetes bacterium]|nr:BamA/TamA family outer membrane protein [Bacteroidota bacterium]